MKLRLIGKYFRLTPINYELKLGTYRSTRLYLRYTVVF